MRIEKILITGGCGFIGSHLADKLVSQGFQVTIADNLYRKSASNIKHIRNKIKFLHIDVSTFNGALKATQDQDVVFNLAAVNTGVDYDIGRTQYMFEENMLLQLQPLRAAYQNGVKRFIQMSSASIYSRFAMEKQLPTTEANDKDEPEVSKLGYALAKKMGENLARWYSQNTELSTCIARPINVYGTRDHFDEKGHFIPSIIKKLVHANKKIEIFGTGKQKRSFLHVSDVTDALLLLMAHGRNGETYNIDSQDEHSIKDIVLHIQKIMKKQDITLIYNIALPEGSKRRLLDNTKIKSLGWKPVHFLYDSLPEVIQDIQSRAEHEKKE